MYQRNIAKTESKELFFNEKIDLTKLKGYFMKYIGTTNPPSLSCDGQSLGGSNYYPLLLLDSWSALRRRTLQIRQTHFD